MCLIRQGLILDGTLKAGKFTIADEIDGQVSLSNIRLLNQYFDLSKSKTNRILHFVIADTAEDRDDDGNWVQIFHLHKDLGRGIITGKNIFADYRYLIIESAQLVRMKDINAN